MWYDELFIKVEKMADKVQGKKMSAYMQNKFPFLGIPKPKLKEAIKPYLKTGKQYGLDWSFINICWEKGFREAQYIGLEYLTIFTKKLEIDDLDKLKTIAINKPWWETVDTIDAFVGYIVEKYPETEKVMLDWSTCDNMWLKRISIDYQQKFKEKTNKELMEKIIINNLGSNEFFINKSIGWSLREYSKVNPTWVKAFIDKHGKQMDKLSIIEASKYIAL